MKKTESPVVCHCIDKMWSWSTLKVNQRGSDFWNGPTQTTFPFSMTKNMPLFVCMISLWPNTIHLSQQPVSVLSQPFLRRSIWNKDKRCEQNPKAFCAFQYTDGWNSWTRTRVYGQSTWVVRVLWCKILLSKLICHVQVRGGCRGWRTTRGQTTFWSRTTGSPRPYLPLLTRVLLSTRLNRTGLLSTRAFLKRTRWLGMRGGRRGSWQKVSTPNYFGFPPKE